MTKIAYLANYHEGTGYSIAAQEYINALATATDVACRPVTITGSKGYVSPAIELMEKKSLDGVDVVIQSMLPNMMSYRGGAQNIANFYYETSGFPNTPWETYLTMMDKIVVACKAQAEAIAHQTKDRLSKKVFIVPVPVDINKASGVYPPINFGTTNNCYKFYTIGELTRRKSIETLLTGYFTEFTAEDNVLLVVKTHVPSRDANATRQMFKNICDEVRGGCRRFSNPDAYPRVVLIDQYLTNEQIYGLHQSCDAFVSTSRGESHCLPAIDSMLFSKPVIASNCGAFKDYIKHEETGFLIDTHFAPIIGVGDAPFGLYTSDEQWSLCDAAHLMLLMRDLYDNQKAGEVIGEKANEFIKVNYNYTTVGGKYLDVLNQ